MQILPNSATYLNILSDAFLRATQNPICGTGRVGKDTDTTGGRYRQDLIKEIRNLDGGVVVRK